MKEGNPDGTSFLQHCPGVGIVEPVAFLSAIRPLLDPSP